MIDDPRDHSACLGLGSNSGPEAHLPLALTAVGRTFGVEVVAVSSAWESPAVGTRGPDYLNAALIVRTGLSMEALKAELRRIEADLGRVRSREPCPLVTIDIDLLTFDANVIEPDLWNLAYRALPVSELLPDLISPSTGEALADAAIRLAGTTRIAARPEVLPTTAHEVAPS